MSVNTNPVHEYPLDHGSGTTIYDSVNGQDGGLSSELWVSNSNASGTYALQFASSNSDEATIPHADTMSHTGSFTIYLEFTPTALPASGDYATLLTKGLSIATDSGNEYSFWLDETGSFSFEVTLGSGNDRIWVSDTFSTGTWYRVAGRFDYAGDGIADLWVNGTQSASTSVSNSANTTTNAFSLGFDATRGSFYSDSEIGAAAIWDVALTDSELQSLTTDGLVSNVDLQGQVTLDGTGVGGATVIVINDTKGEIAGTATTNSDGTYTVTVPEGDTYHTLVQYDDGTDLYNDVSKPFVVANSS